MYTINKHIVEVDPNVLKGKTVAEVKQNLNSWSVEIDHFMITFTDGSSIEFVPDSYSELIVGRGIEQSLDVHYTEGEDKPKDVYRDETCSRTGCSHNGTCGYGAP